MRKKLIGRKHCSLWTSLITRTSDWWEGEKFIKLFGIKAVGEFDISEGIYE